jgi:DNA-binding transcriptional ArsR family regulator
MDRRTEQLLDALAHPGAAFVFALLARGPLLEDDLKEIANTSQSTANRKLDQLGDMHVLARAPGRRQTRGRPWTVATPDAARTFLVGAFDLSRAVDEIVASERDAAERALRDGGSGTPPGEGVRAPQT